jgi:ribonuclease PH
MARFDGRKNDEFRPVTLERNFLKYAAGSCIITMGNTKVLCAVTIDDTFVPEFRKEHGGGWIDAEYALMPASTLTRSNRKTNGRAIEIQRIIGRAMRTACDPLLIGERTIWIDCDVLQADGGTRTAAITGAFVALYDAIEGLVKDGKLEKNPIEKMVSAISIGMVNGEIMLDLCYEEDHIADVDMNFVMTEDGNFIEVQGTGEKVAFTREMLDRFADMAYDGIKRLSKIQREALGI